MGSLRLTARGVAMALTLATLSTGALACTRVFWNDNGQAKVVGRTMDLFRSDDARIVVSPRGTARSSKMGDGKSLDWHAKHGSVAVTAFGVATSDGMNEPGLVANLLYLDKTTYEARDSRPGLSNAMWAQYVLDNFATVAEALDGLKAVQVVSAEVAGKTWPLHLSLADATGDSAVIEYVDGKMVVHHGKQFQVMTNEPPLDVQLANLPRYKLFGGQLPMPGDIDPQSRFVRAASYLKTLPKPQDVRHAVAGAYAVIRNVAVPPGSRGYVGARGNHGYLEHAVVHHLGPDGQGVLLPVHQLPQSVLGRFQQGRFQAGRADAQPRRLRHQP